MSGRELALRVRAADAGDADQPRTVLRRDWDAGRAAVVICDMWDAHHCASAAARVAEMAPRMNEVAFEDVELCAILEDEWRSRSR